MDAAKKLADKHNLQDLVPLNALSDSRFAEVAKKIVVEEIRKGRYLFRKGDRDNQSIYLLGGKINLIDGHRKVTGEVEAGTDTSRYPLAHQQPRTLSARAVTKVVIARIDSGLLDVFLTWDQTSSTEATEIRAEDNEDWMSQMLQSDAFIKIPPAMIQRLLIKMEAHPVSRGDVVIRQGDDGDFFYTIHRGTCVVTRSSEDGGEVKLAELSGGDCFGEESLVSDARRNASVTMTSDGLLMRLAKEDFVDLLQKPLVRRVGYEQALGMVDEGAVWLDVRSPGEYENSAFEDSANIPLAELRGEMPELVYNAKYIICCDTGRRSASAAFILSHKGFEVYVLDGGMNGLPLEAAGDAAPQPEADAVAGVPPVAAAGVVDLQAKPDAATDVQTSAMEPATAAQDQAAPEQLAEQEALHSEIAGLRQQIEAHAGIEQQLAGSEAAVSGLQQEVTRMKTQEGLLREQYAALQVEYDERLLQVRRELQQSQEASASLQAQIESADHEKQRQLDRFEAQQGDWQQRITTLEEQLAGLTREYEAVLAERDSGREQLAVQQAAAETSTLQQQEAVSHSQAELDALARHRDSLDKELQAQRQRAADLQQQLETREAGEDSQAAVLQEHNQQLQQSLEALQADMASLQSERQTVEEQAASHVAEQQEVSSRLQAELDALAQHREQLDGELQAQRQRAADLQQQLEARVAGQESEAAVLQQHRQQLQAALDAAESEKRDILVQLEALQESQAEDRGQLEQSAEQADLARREVAELQQELETLRADGHEKLEDSQVARLAAEEALQRQQQEWDGERAALQDELGSHRDTITDLQEQLDKSREQASCELARLEEEIGARGDKAMRQVEQLEARHVELEQERKQLQEELQQAMAGRDEVQQQLDSEIQQGAALAQEIENLNGRLSALAAESQAEIGSLNGQLQAEQQRAAEAGRQLEEGKAGSEELRVALAQQEETASQLRNELESQAQQLEATRLELQQAVEHSRSIELESEELLRKAWDDLNRKNDTEKQMQGQITRLRKKLESSATDLQQVREEAHESAAQARDALHAERKERADERAQMAARQKELKEQLLALAEQHEALRSSQKGALVQAENAARNDERARLKDVLQTHAQAEDQLAVMRQELARAREETERAVSEERQRNTADLELARVQKTDLDAVVAEQEARLQALTDERDAAVSEQQSIRQQFNSLRAEVEVARGLINADGRDEVENPVKLRAELEEARRNLDIAIRVRSEAESARDTALAERDAMQWQLEEAGADAMPLTIPSLDEQDDRGPVKVTSPATARTVVPDAAAGGGTQNVATAELVPDRARKRSWLARAAGLGAMALALSAFWFMLESRESVVPDTRAVTAQVAGTTSKDVENKAAGMAPPVAKGNTPEPASPAVTAKPRSQVRPGSPATAAKPGPQPEPVRPAVAAKPRPQPKPARAPAAAPEITPVVAGRSFSDALRDGGRGPTLVELPAATFLMGSSGASPNFTERPQHAVTLTAFAIGKYEVTFAEYDRFARATGRRLPYDEGWGRGQRPVINISWKDATAYAAWLSKQTGHTYRLPSEAQWEFAARAGTGTPYWWADSSEEVQANCFNCGSQWDGKMSAAVGSFSPNGLGLHDTSGNVQEWTQDCYHNSYQGAPSDGSAWQSAGCSQRVVRGGAYSSPADSLRSARRAQFEQETRLDNIGFRVVRLK